MLGMSTMFASSNGLQECPEVTWLLMEACAFLLKCFFHVVSALSLESVLDGSFKHARQIF